MTVSRKNPPFTRLETLSKSKIWLITCWPFFLALMVLLLDTNSDMHTTSIAFSQSHCALPLQCYTRTISSEEKKEKGILNDGIAITFTLPMQALLLHFVNVVGSITLQAPTSDTSFFGKSIYLSIDTSLQLNALDENGKKTQSLITDSKINKRFDVVVQERVTQFGKNALSNRTKSRTIEYDYELGVASLARPWLLSQSKTIEGEIVLIASAQTDEFGSSFEDNSALKMLENKILQNAISGSTFKLEYQRELFTFVRAILQIFTSLVTLLCLIDYLRLLKNYHQVLYNHSFLPVVTPYDCFNAHAKNDMNVNDNLDDVENKTVSSSSSFSGKTSGMELSLYKDSEGICPANKYYFVSFYLAEQVYTVLLLLFLFVWVDPLGALNTVILLSSSVSTNENILWLSDFSKSAAQQGLYFTLLLFLISLGTVPKHGEGSYSFRQDEALPDVPASHSDHGSDELSWVSQTPPKFSSQRLSLESSNRFSWGSERQSSSRSMNSPPPSALHQLPEWVFEPNQKEDFEATIVEEGGTPASAAKITEEMKDDNENPRWLHTPTSSDGKGSPAKLMDGTSSTHGREVLCRSYIESSPDDRIDLIPSHPSSRHFCSFLASRLLFFVLCLLVVSLQVITTYPSLYVPITTKLRAHSAMSSLLVERSLYVLFSVALVACRFSWIVKIYKATIASARKLKETKYMSSRYQQLAFRLFVNQILVGLMLLLLSYIMLVGRSIGLIYHGLKHDFASSSSSFSSTGTDVISSEDRLTWSTVSHALGEVFVMVDASFEEGFGVWGGKDSEIGEILYVACICFTITFLFSPPSLELNVELEGKDGHADCNQKNIFLQADHGIAGELYQYDVLEADNFDWYKLASGAGGHMHYPFCLETALLLMECSWQSYYAPALAKKSYGTVDSISIHKDKADAEVENNEEGYFSALLGSTLRAKMNVAQYGIALIQNFRNETGDITGFVASDDYQSHCSRIILCFRGTAEASNMITDLNFFQTALNEDDMKLKSSAVHALVDEVAVSLRRKKPRQIIDKSKRTNEASTNPFDAADLIPTTPQKRSASPSELSCSSISKSPVVKNTASASSLNPFDECIVSGGERDERNEAKSSQESDTEDRRDITNVLDGNKPEKVKRSFCSCCSCASAHGIAKVHTGFYRAYLTVRSQVMKAMILSLIHVAKNRRGNTSNDTDTFPLDIQICGHSLGGALANFASLDLAINGQAILSAMNLNSSKLKVSAYCPRSIARILTYTYGSPRVGNKMFADWLQKEVPNIFRVEVDGDLICRMPHLSYTCGSYQHAGTHILISADHSGNLMIDPNVVEKQFLRRGNGTTDYHTLCHYRTCFEACFTPPQLQYFVSKYYLRGKHLESLKGY